MTEEQGESEMLAWNSRSSMEEARRRAWWCIFQRLATEHLTPEQANQLAQAAQALASFRAWP